jgi:hypothetical protein
MTNVLIGLYEGLNFDIQNQAKRQPYSLGALTASR